MPRKRKIVIICLIFAEFLANVPFLDRNIFLNFLMLEKKVVRFSCFFLVFPQVAQWRETFTWRCLVKNVFLNIFQNSHENTYARIFFLIKLQTCKCFPVNFAKFLRTSFFIEHLWCKTF